MRGLPCPFLSISLATLVAEMKRVVTFSEANGGLRKDDDSKNLRSINLERGIFVWSSLSLES